MGLLPLISGFKWVGSRPRQPDPTHLLKVHTFLNTSWYLEERILIHMVAGFKIQCCAKHSTVAAGYKMAKWGFNTSQY